MRNILRPETDPLGGNKDIYFIPDVGVDAVNRVLSNTVSIDYATGKKFYKMECVDFTSVVKQAGAKTALGQLYDITVNAIVAGNISDNEEVLQEMLDYKFIIAKVDNNCNTTILANTEQPLEFTITGSSKTGVDQRKDIEVRFAGQCYMHEKTLSGTLEVYS